MARVIFEKLCEINHTKRVKRVIHGTANSKGRKNLEEKKKRKKIREKEGSLKDTAK
jgi:hypothetical protein